MALAYALPALSSCAPRSPKPGMALVEINTDNIRSGRVNHPAFVRHNGKDLRTARKHLHLEPGPQELDLYCKFSGLPESRTTLKFEAKPDCSYVVRFDLMPVFRGKKPMGEGDLAMADLPLAADPISAMIFLVGLPLEIGGRMVGSGAHNMSGNFKDVEQATIDVISSEMHEGIVFRAVVPE